MRFFALQVTCDSCQHAFLVGGAAANDLDIWRAAMLDCPRCGGACRAIDGDVVGLTSRRRKVDAEPLVEDPTVRTQRRRADGWDRRGVAAG